MDSIALLLIGIALFIGLIIAWKYKYSWGDTFALLFALFLIAIILIVIFDIQTPDPYYKGIIIIGLIALAYILLWIFYTLWNKY
jgi:predicted MFS family arabinose efflux permease